MWKLLKLFKVRILDKCHAIGENVAFFATVFDLWHFVFVRNDAYLAAYFSR